MNFDYEKRNWDYSLNLKKAALLTLIAFNLLFLFSPRIDFERPEVNNKTIVTIDVENIPVTRQSRRVSPPPRPTIPIPTDDEIVPEDETIAVTDLSAANVFNYPKGAPAGASITPPRPIAWVFPEFPESEKKRGVQGMVKLSLHINEQGEVIEVVVLQNTTGSEKCAEAATVAAYGSHFSPAREGGRAIRYWLTQPYRFDSGN